MSDLVEFRHLKYIVAVAETGNFTRAAERLFLAQPSLSKQIKDVEDEIGLPIFIRTRDGVRATPAGQMMISYAQEALRVRGEFIAMAQAVHHGDVSPLRLGFSSFVSPNHLDSFRESYASSFPNCSIQLSSGTTAKILERLEQRSLDAALLPLPIEGAVWVVQQLAESPLVVCMRSDDPLARSGSVMMTDLAPRLKVFRDPDSHPAAHSRLIEMLFDAGIVPEIACRADTPSDIQLMVRCGYGVALIDQNTILEYGLVSRPIAGVQWTADTAFVHHHNADHVALPFLNRILQRGFRDSPNKRTALKKPESPVQLDLLA